MKPKAYPVLIQAIEEGLLLGLNRAEEKGSITESSNNAVARNTIHESVMLCVCEYFSFEDED